MTRTTLLLILLLIAAALWSGWYQYQNAKAVLQDWADAHRLRILQAKYSLFVWSVPLTWLFTTSKYQLLWHVSVYDESTHRIRSAWLRFRMYPWGGLRGDGIDEKWEDDS